MLRLSLHLASGLHDKGRARNHFAIRLRHIFNDHIVALPGVRSDCAAHVAAFPIMESNEWVRGHEFVHVLRFLRPIAAAGNASTGKFGGDDRRVHFPIVDPQIVHPVGMDVAAQYDWIRNLAVRDKFEQGHPLVSRSGH